MTARQRTTRQRTNWGNRGSSRTAWMASPAQPRQRHFSPSFWIGASLTLLFLLAAILAPRLAPYAPEQIMAAPSLAPPSAAHPFGADLLGRDMLSRVLYGARIAVRMALLGVGISVLLGVSLGVLAGFYGSWVDQILSRLFDIWLAFPGLLLAIVIVARMGPSLNNAVIALGVVGAPTFFRLMRSNTLSARQMAYVEAAESVGAGDLRIMLRHILPNVSSSLIILITTRLGLLILSGGGLSFIGLGAQPPSPEWGALLSNGRDYMETAPWLAIYPGLCITLTVAGLNLLGDGLRDALDVRRNG